jgi:hypothetical protein
VNTGLESVGPLTRTRVDAALTVAMAKVDQEHTTNWSWRYLATTIELRGNLPPVPDPRHRELMVTGGALLLNLRVLIRGLGVHVAVQTMPDLTQRDLVAVVRLEGPRTITAEDRALVDAVLLDGPGTAPSGRDPVSKPLFDRLRRAAKVEQTWLAQLPDGFHDDRAVAAPPRHGSVAPAPAGSARVVIGTVLDGAATRLQAGQGMQRVLLTAATGAVPARPMPLALRNPVARQAVRDQIGGGLWPQAVLVLGARSAADGGTTLARSTVAGSG